MGLTGFVPLFDQKQCITCMHTDSGSKPKRLRRFLRFLGYPVTALVAFWLGTHYLAAVTDDVVTEDGRRVDGIRAYETRDGTVKTVNLDLNRESERPFGIDFSKKRKNAKKR